MRREQLCFDSHMLWNKSSYYFCIFTCSCVQYFCFRIYIMFPILCLLQSYICKQLIISYLVENHLRQYYRCNIFYCKTACICKHIFSEYLYTEFNVFFLQRVCQEWLYLKIIHLALVWLDCFPVFEGVFAVCWLVAMVAVVLFLEI